MWYPFSDSWSWALFISWRIGPVNCKRRPSLFQSFAISIPNCSNSSSVGVRRFTTKIINSVQINCCYRWFSQSQYVKKKNCGMNWLIFTKELNIYLCVGKTSKICSPHTCNCPDKVSYGKIPLLRALNTKLTREEERETEPETTLLIQSQKMSLALHRNPNH